MSLLILTAAAEHEKHQDTGHKQKKETWSGFQLDAEEAKRDAEWEELSRPRPKLKDRVKWLFGIKREEVPAPIVKTENELPPIYLKIVPGSKEPKIPYHFSDLYFFQDGFNGAVYPAIKLTWIDVPTIGKGVATDVRKLKNVASANLVDVYADSRARHTQTVKDLPAEQFATVVAETLASDEHYFLHEDARGVGGKLFENNRVLLNSVKNYKVRDLGIRTLADALVLCEYMTANQEQFGVRYDKEHGPFNKTMSAFRDYKQQLLLKESTQPVDTAKIKNALA